MNPYLTSQDEAKLIKPVIIKYNHTGVKCAIRRIWSVKGKHNVRHMARLVGKGLITGKSLCEYTYCRPKIDPFDRSLMLLDTLQKQNFHFKRAFVKAKIHFSNR